WGRAGRARTRSGDGEGWGRDRERGAPCWFSACGGGGGRRMRIAERHPHVRIGLRLAFYEAVAGVRPQHDVLRLIVEDEVTLVGLHGEDRVAFVLLVAHHG